MDQSDAHLQARKNEKDAAMADIHNVLHQIEVERRNPDQWERVHLVQAFTAVFSGCYTLASVEARSALVPLAARSPATQLPTDPIFEQCDLSLLMRVCQAAHNEPVEQFPHFGPVALKAAAPNVVKSWMQ